MRVKQVLTGMGLSGQYWMCHSGIGCSLFLSVLVMLFVFLTSRLSKYFSLPEEDAAEQPQLKKGTMYLVKGRNVERSYALFSNAVGKKANGLLITRKSPHHVKAAYNLSEVPILWLSQKEEGDVLYPTQLDKLVYLISKALDQQNAIILLDGIEYLIVHNRFKRVLKQLYIIREVVYRHGGILLIPLDPDAFSEKELGFLEKESVPI